MLIPQKNRDGMWMERAQQPSHLVHDYPEHETPSKQYENGAITNYEVITGLPRSYHNSAWYVVVVLRYHYLVSHLTINV